MRNKNFIDKLYEKGIIGKKPAVWVPFFFSAVFLIYGYLSEKINLNWSTELYWVSGFSFVWGILHWIVVRRVTHSSSK